MAKGGMVVVTGTDTGVGKTVMAGLLTRALRKSGAAVAALKPICSGNRTDARRLRAAAGRVLSLGEVNPWWFQAPLTPLMAARQEGRLVRLAAVLNHVRTIRFRFDWVVLEGAGGLLSPLGEDFDTRTLIQKTGARVVVVGVNRLGVINQVLLTVRALPRPFAREARTILMTPRRADLSSRSNPGVLQERLGAGRVEVLPWLTAAGLRCASTVPPALLRVRRWLLDEPEPRNAFSDGQHSG